MKFGGENKAVIKGNYQLFQIGLQGIFASAPQNVWNVHDCNWCALCDILNHAPVWHTLRGLWSSILTFFFILFEEAILFYMFCGNSATWMGNGFKFLKNSVPGVTAQKMSRLQGKWCDSIKRIHFVLRSTFWASQVKAPWQILFWQLVFWLIRAPSVKRLKYL